MKNIIKTTLFFATLLLGVASCSKSDHFTSTPDSKEVILTAYVGAESKINIDAPYGAGAKFSWQQNDQLAVYNDLGELESLFVLFDGVGSKSGKFKLQEGVYDPDKANTYTVTYPYNGARKLDERYKSLEHQYQKGNDGTDSLNVWLKGTTSVQGAENQLTLNHELALLTLHFEAPTGYNSSSDIISKFSFYDGLGHTYNLHLSDLMNFEWGALETNRLKLHLFVRPTATAQPCRISVYTIQPGGGQVFSCSETPQAPFAAGSSRYMLDDDLKLLTGTTLADLGSYTITNDEIVVTDGFDENQDLSALKAKIEGHANPVVLSLPNATGIKASSFDGCAKIKYVDAPMLLRVGSWAFKNCSELQGVNMQNLTFIDKYAFESTHKLDYFGAPSLIEIGEGGFIYSKGLAEIDMPNLTKIGNEAFASTSALSRIVLPGVTSIGNSAFNNSSLTEVSMANLEVMGQSAFERCTRLNSVNMPRLTKVSVWGFWGCSALENVVLLQVQEIEDGAFKNCAKLGAVIFPRLTKTVKFTFYDCKQLKGPNAVQDFPALETVGEGTFWYCEALQDVSLPKATDLSAKDIFRGCAQLRSIDIPMATSLGYHVFSACPQLNTLHIATQSGGITRFDGGALGEVSTDKINLTVGWLEQANVEGNKWRGYTFKSVIVVPRPTN